MSGDDRITTTITEKPIDNRFNKPTSQLATLVTNSKLHEIDAITKKINLLHLYFLNVRRNRIKLPKAPNKYTTPNAKSS